jgi:biotin carboxyl carrier protein
MAAQISGSSESDELVIKLSPGKVHEGVMLQIRQLVPQIIDKVEINTRERAEQGLVDIKAPLLGTFYHPELPMNSGAEPFLKVGDHVESGTVVCIIEAMMVMNEVKAGVAGTVTEVLYKYGDAVEYNAVLFRIKSD